MATNLAPEFNVSSLKVNLCQCLERLQHVDGMPLAIGLNPASCINVESAPASGLQIKTVGAVSLPMTVEMYKRICGKQSICRNFLGDLFVPASALMFDVFDFPHFALTRISKLEKKVGAGDAIPAKLMGLLISKPGSSGGFSLGSNISSAIGLAAVILPSYYTGGTVIRQCTSQDRAMTLSAGSQSDTIIVVVLSNHGVRFTPIISGYRVALVFKLNPDNFLPPSLTVAMDRLRHIFRYWKEGGSHFPTHLYYDYGDKDVGEVAGALRDLFPDVRHACRVAFEEGIKVQQALVSYYATGRASTRGAELSYAALKSLRFEEYDVTNSFLEIDSWTQLDASGDVLGPSTDEFERTIAMDEVLNMPLKYLRDHVAPFDLDILAAGDKISFTKVYIRRVLIFSVRAWPGDSSSGRSSARTLPMPELVRSESTPQ